MKRLLVLGVLVLGIAAFGLAHKHNSQGQNGNSEGQHSSSQGNDDGEGENDGQGPVQMPEGPAFELPLFLVSVGSWGLWRRHSRTRNDSSQG